MATLVQIADVHFGRDVDLAQVAQLEAVIPAFAPTAIIVAGDLTQRARHGELQAALGLVERLGRFAPTLVIPGNHDVEWWRSPFGVLGSRRPFAKYRQYFGENLSPTLELPGLVVGSVLTSHGVAWKSLTWKFWRDTAVKGHLPLSEIERARNLFDRAASSTLKVLVLHHNVLRGAISKRMGLSRWRSAAERIAASGADVVLVGHDHQEAMGLLGDRVVVAAAGTHTSRTRGGRPSAFNVVHADHSSIRVTHYVWNAGLRRFAAGPTQAFPRRDPSAEMARTPSPVAAAK